MFIRSVLLLTALCFFAGCAASSRTSPSTSSGDTIYFDAAWHESTKERASFYRTHERYNDTLYRIRDYYRNGRLQMEGLSKTITPLTRNDTFWYYNPYGGKSSVEPYSNGKLNGERREWYPNGQLHKLDVFRDGKRDGPSVAWDQAGRKIFEGGYVAGKKQGLSRDWYGYNTVLRDSGRHDHGVMIGFWKEYFDDGTLSGQSDSLIVGEPGTWTWYHHSGQVAAIEHYANDSLLDGQYWNPDGSDMQDRTQVDRDPEFPGGDDALNAFVGAHLKYPETARRNGTEARVDVLFMVAEDGSLRNIEISRGHPELDDAALAVIRAMPKWHPGRQHNRIVSAYMVVPLVFRLKE